MRPFALALMGSSLLCLSASASAADRELLTKAGEAGTLAFDQLAGFRMTNANGFGFAGPLGFTYQSSNIDAGAGFPSATQRATTLFVAPSLDVFVAEQFSVGGTVQFQWQNQSLELEPGGKVDLPATLGFSIVPRLGYLFRIGDRIGIWPRLGAGYSTSQVATGPGSKATSNALLLEADVGFVYRVNEVFFLRLAPALTLSPVGGTSVGSGASRTTTFLAFSSTLGFGLFWDP